MLLSPKYLPRLAAMVGLFTRYGLRDLARGQGLQAIAPDEFAHDEGDVEDMAARAKAFRHRLVELGPAYVKLGQVLSTRPDLLPDPYIHELTQLQDDVSPLAVEDVRAIIEEQLQARISKLFATFDEEPLGSASLGQVHAAELRDGRSVVVKVQRPAIRQALADDIAFFREVAHFLADHTSAGHRIDIVGVIQQLERALSDELDYRVEARNAATFRRNLAQFPRVLIPRVIEAYTTECVLTTERIRGVKIGDVPPVARIEHDFRPLAEDFAKAYLKQITVDGHFHADPHPGNVFIVLPGHANPKTPSEIVAGEQRASPRPVSGPLARIEQQARAQAAPQPPDAEVKLALIDFGMTAHLADQLREQIVRLLLDMADNRGDSAANTLIEMGERVDGFDRTGYVRDISTLIARNYDRSVGDLQAGLVLYEVLNISFSRGLKLPSELTLLAKAMFNLDAVSRALDPTYNPIDAIREYGNEIAAERAKREMSPSRMFQMMTQTSDLLTVLPHRLDVITQRLVANELQFGIDAPQLPMLLKGMQKIANRVFSGLVLAGLTIASAMLYPHNRNLGSTGFTLAGGIALYMVGNILLTDRRERKR